MLRIPPGGSYHPLFRAAQLFLACSDGLEHRPQVTTLVLLAAAEASTQDRSWQMIARSLFAKKPPYSLENTVLFWVVWVVFAGYLKYCWECICICIHPASYSFRNLSRVNGRVQFSK